MDAVLRWFRKLGILVRRERFHRELQEEMAYHRQQSEQELQAAGMESQAAHYAAVRQLGNVTRLEEDSAGTGGFRWETKAQVVRYDARQVRKNPGFASATIGVWRLGNGARQA